MNALDQKTCRLYGQALLKSLYVTARLDGARLRVTAAWACDFLGLDSTVAGMRRDVADLLAYLRDHPPEGWEVEDVGTAEHIALFVRPKTTLDVGRFTRDQKEEGITV